MKFWEAPRLKYGEYPLSDSEKEEKAYQLSLHSLLTREISPEESLGLQILSYLLLDVPGAVLRERLVSAGIAEDVEGGFTTEIRFPYFSVYARNAPKDREEDFRTIIREVLLEVAEKGLDTDAVLAALNIYEFRLRESDFGRYPKGLIYGISAMENWLYDKDPMVGLRYDTIFGNLRERLEKGYLQELIREHLLDNPHTLTLVLKPRRGLREEANKSIQEELSRKKSSLSGEKIKEIMEEENALLSYQTLESSPEDLLKIPLLLREEIGKKAVAPIWEKSRIELEDGSVSCIHSDVFTSGIAYMTLLFDAGDLEKEDLFKMALLQELFKKVNTEKGSYFDLTTRINKDSGGISLKVSTYEDCQQADKARIFFSVIGKAVHEKMETVLSLMEEIFLTSSFEDKKRIREILLEAKAGRKDGLLAGGHMEAHQHAASGFSKSAWLTAHTGGIEYYHYLEKLLSDFDSLGDVLLADLKKLKARLFTRDRLLVHLTAEKNYLPRFQSRIRLLAKKLPLTGRKGKGISFECRQFSHAFKSSSAVNYVAKAGNFARAGFSYTGLLRVLRVILNYNYLWKNVREQGGAYGCYAMFGRNGVSGFVSYRDPNLEKTFSAYEGSPDFIRDFSADEREMTKYVIGAISDLDIPLTPKQKGELGLGSYIRGLTHEDFQRERDEILSADLSGIRRLYPLLQALLSEANETVLGMADKIEEAGKRFDLVEDLYHE